VQLAGSVGFGPARVGGDRSLVLDQVLLAVEDHLAYRYLHVAFGTFCSVR